MRHRFLGFNATMSTPLQHEVLEHGGLHTIVLNDDARRNMLGDEMFAALDAALRDTARAVAARHESSVVVLAARGRAFSSGFDLAACVRDEACAARFLHQLADAIARLRALPCPVVAAVQGPALAGGCALVTACDIVVAGPRATFGYPVHRIGLSPAISLPTLRAGAGGAARTLALGSDPIDVRAAQAIGVVHEALDAGDPIDRAHAIARGLLCKGPQAIASIKRWMNAHDGSCDEALRSATCSASVATSRSPESKSMLTAVWASARRA